MRQLMSVMPITEDDSCVWYRARSDVSFEGEFNRVSNICMICALLYMLETSHYSDIRQSCIHSRLYDIGKCDVMHEYIKEDI